MNDWIAVVGALVVAAAVLLIVVFATRLKCDWFNIGCGDGAGGTPPPVPPCSVTSDDQFKVSFPQLKREGDSCVLKSVRPVESAMSSPPTLERLTRALGGDPSDPDRLLAIVKTTDGKLALRSSSVVDRAEVALTVVGNTYFDGPDCRTPLINSSKVMCPDPTQTPLSRCWSAPQEWGGQCSSTDDCKPSSLCGVDLDPEDMKKCNKEGCRYGPMQLSIDGAAGAAIAVVKMSTDDG